MQVTKLPVSHRRSLRRSKSHSNRWLAIAWTTITSGLTSRIIPALRPMSFMPVVLPIAAIATPIGHSSALPNQNRYANRFVVTPIAQVRSPGILGGPNQAEVAGVPLVGPRVSPPTIESGTSESSTSEKSPIDDPASDKIYDAERRLLLAHAINDRPSIARIRAELDRLF
jgi:hypothetical protein